MKNRSRVVRRRAVLIATVLIAAISATSPAGGAGVEHGDLVLETPTLAAPDFLDGEVLAGTQVGNRIIVGGSFSMVEDTTLGVVEQPFLAAYDVDTGRLDTEFLPRLDGRVNGIADAGDGTIVVVGRFRRVDGTSRDRVAKLRVVDGSVVTTFVANASAQVFDVAVANDRAYLGGSFASINGVSRSRLAAVDLHTGTVDPGFDLPATDPTGWEGASSVRAVDVSPNGRKLAIAHNNALVNGLPRQGVALIDISGPVAAVLPWQTDNYDYDCQPWFPQFPNPLMRDVAFSPDGSYIVVASAIGNFAPGCDVAVRFPTVGGAGVEPDWVSRMFDSPETVAISDTAVYLGGHMRWAMAPGTVWTDFADGNTNDQPDGTVARDQIVAISPEDGTALEWDPGAGGFRGVLSLAVVDAGLLAGSDGDRFGGATVGKHALFALPDDPPPPDGAAPSSTFVAPVDGGSAATGFPLIVESSDDTAVADVTITRRRNSDGLYLQPGGGFAPGPTDLSPLVLDTGTRRATAMRMLQLPPGSYTAMATAVDHAGTVELTPTAVTFGVTAGAGTTGPDGRFFHPENPDLFTGPVTLSGLAWDDGAIDKIRVIIRDLDTGDYMQNDGTFAPGFNRMWVLPDQRGEPTSTFSWTWELPDGRYRAWLHLKDDADNADPVKDRVNFRVRIDG